jgi:hypothetical protein
MTPGRQGLAPSGRIGLERGHASVQIGALPFDGFDLGRELSRRLAVCRFKPRQFVLPAATPFRELLAFNRSSSDVP